MLRRRFLRRRFLGRRFLRRGFLGCFLLARCLRRLLGSGRGHRASARGLLFGSCLSAATCLLANSSRAGLLCRLLSGGLLRGFFAGFLASGARGLFRTPLCGLGSQPLGTCGHRFTGPRRPRSSALCYRCRFVFVVLFVIEVVLDVTRLVVAVLIITICVVTGVGVLLIIVPIAVIVLVAIIVVVIGATRLFVCTVCTTEGSFAAIGECLFDAVVQISKLERLVDVCIRSV